MDYLTTGQGTIKKMPMSENGDIFGSFNEDIRFHDQRGYDVATGIDHQILSPICVEPLDPRYRPEIDANKYLFKKSVKVRTYDTPLPP